MSCPSTPYDILGIISFVQGTLTLTAAVLGAIWSFTYQVLSRSLLFRQESLVDTTFSTAGSSEQDVDGEPWVQNQTSKRHTSADVLIRNGQNTTTSCKVRCLSLLLYLKTETFRIRLQEQEKKLNDMTDTQDATLLKQWLKQWFEQSKNALKLADISNKIETIVLRFYLVGAFSSVLIRHRAVN